MFSVMLFHSSSSTVSVLYRLVVRCTLYIVHLYIFVCTQEQSQEWSVCSPGFVLTIVTINKLNVDFQYLFKYHQTNNLTFSDLMNTLYPIRYVNLKYKTELTFIWRPNQNYYTKLCMYLSLSLSVSPFYNINIFYQETPK